MVSNKKNIIFDFDGVLADTSLIKSHVFKKFFLKFSQSQKIIDYQIKNKGISRYQILDKLYELEDINSKKQKKNILEDLNSAMNSSINKIKIDNDIINKIKKFYKSANLFIASNAPENELISIIKNNGIYNYFLGIYGSKQNFTKKDSINLIINNFNIDIATYIGDTYNDYKIARAIGLNFIGIKNIYLEKITGINLYNSIIEIDEKSIQ